VKKAANEDACHKAAGGAAAELGALVIDVQLVTAVRIRRRRNLPARWARQFRCFITGHGARCPAWNG